MHLTLFWHVSVPPSAYTEGWGAWVLGPGRLDRGEWSACPSTWGPIVSSVRSTCPVCTPSLGASSSPWLKLWALVQKGLGTNHI